jgi:putative peptidoglycan lipid II flippase
MRKNFTSTVAGASILITVVSLLGKGFGFVREIVFANFFGLNTQYDLYLVGAVLPLTINTIILYLGQNYFIPTYNKTKIEKPEGIHSFINSTFWSFSSLGLLLAAILFIFSVHIVKFYLHSASVAELNSTVNVFRIILFTIPLNSAYSILAAYLQSEFEFKSPAVSQLLLNVSIILLVFIFSNKIGIYTIPFGYVVGSIAQLIFLLVRSLKKIGLNLFSFINGGSIRSIINYPLVITILIESISQIYLLADRYFFGSVQNGGIASLNYAMNIFLLPVTIISVALSTAIFPKFSYSFNSNNKEDLQSKIDNFFSVNLFLFVPISFVLIYFGDIIIRLIFQHGEFNTNDTLMTFNILKYYSISLVFYSSYAVLNKLLYGTNMIKPLLYITITGCLIKISANILLVKEFQQNGLAISTSVSYLFFFLAGILLTAYFLKLKIKRFISEFIFGAVNCFLSYGVSILIIPNDLFRYSRFNDILRLLIFVSIYLLNAKIVSHNAVIMFEQAFKSFGAKKLENI